MSDETPAPKDEAPSAEMCQSAHESIDEKMPSGGPMPEDRDQLVDGSASPKTAGENESDAKRSVCPDTWLDEAFQKSPSAARLPQGSPLDGGHGRDTKREAAIDDKIRLEAYLARLSVDGSNPLQRAGVRVAQAEASPQASAHRRIDAGQEGGFLAPQRPLRLFFSVGEPSGDRHAAQLIETLRAKDPPVECVGFGGPEMEEAGCHLLADLTALAIMWFVRALWNLPKFFALHRQACLYFRKHRPDAVILVDYPGFNWHIAKSAHALGIPVFYHLPPQIWAWGQWRIRNMQRHVDHVLCTLPFEHAWFRDHGVRTTWIGHPFFDKHREGRIDERFVALERAQHGSRVTGLPGSRKQEIESNFATFIKAAAAIGREVKDVRFAVAAFNQKHAKWLERQLEGAPVAMEVHVGRTTELIRAADCCMSVSGSVSLELLQHAKPTVILYRVGRLGYWVQGFFRKVKYITLVNLLAANEVFPQDLRPYDPHGPDAEEALFPEYLTFKDVSNQIAAHITSWLKDPVSRRALEGRLRQLRTQVGAPGATENAADYILSQSVRYRKGMLAPHVALAREASDKPKATRSS